MTSELLQAEDLFGIVLNYHHDKYEVLYKTAAWMQFGLLLQLLGRLRVSQSDVIFQASETGPVTEG